MCKDGPILRCFDKSFVLRHWVDGSQSKKSIPRTLTRSGIALRDLNRQKSEGITH